MNIIFTEVKGIQQHQYNVVLWLWCDMIRGSIVKYTRLSLDNRNLRMFGQMHHIGQLSGIEILAIWSSSFNSNHSEFAPLDK